MKKIDNVAWVLALLTLLLWSTVAVVFKLGLKFYSSYQLLMYSSFFSTITLLILFLCFKKKSSIFKFSWRYWGSSILQGLLNPFLYYIILFTAYDHLPAQIAQAVNFTWPIFLSVFAAIFLKEKVKGVMYVSLIISFLGVVVISRGGAGFVGEYGELTKGVLLSLLSAVIWALYWIVNRRDPRPPIVKLLGAFSFSLLYILVYGVITSQLPVIEYSSQLVYPLYIGLFEMSIPFLLWVLAMHKADNTPFLGNLAYLVPVISLFFIRIILKEEIQHGTIIGLIFIIVGVILQARIRHKHR